MRARLPFLVLAVGLAVTGCAPRRPPAAPPAPRAPQPEPRPPAPAATSESPAAEPVLAVAPAAGPPGTRIVVRGSGFPAGVAITLHVGVPLSEPSPHPLARTVADGEGAFTLQLTVPVPAAATRNVVLMAATDNWRHKATVEFIYLDRGAIDLVRGDDASWSGKP